MKLLLTSHQRKEDRKDKNRKENRYFLLRLSLLERKRKESFYNQVFYI
jgi:hypothetical protein